MKPIILPITVNDQGKVSMTLKELEDLLDKAYAAGKADGGDVYYNCPYQPWIVSPNTNPNWTEGPIYTTDHATIGDGDSTSTTTTTAITSNQQ